MPELDVADDMVDPDQQAVGSAGLLVARHEPGEERAVVIAAGDEQVPRVAIGLHRGELHRAVLVGDLIRGLNAAGPVGDGVLVGGRRIRDAERDRPDAVAVALVMFGDLVVAGQRAGQHQPDAALL